MTFDVAPKLFAIFLVFEEAHERHGADLVEVVVASIPVDLVDGFETVFDGFFAGKLKLIDVAVVVFIDDVFNIESFGLVAEVHQHFILAGEIASGVDNGETELPIVLPCVCGIFVVGLRHS